MKKTPPKVKSYSGVKVVEVPKSTIDLLYSQGTLEVDKNFKPLFANQVVYLKSNNTSDKAGAITVFNSVKDNKFSLSKPNDAIRRWLKSITFSPLVPF